MTQTDEDLARFYAPLILRPFKYGENVVAIWYPGSGRRTILSDIFSSPKILKETLGGLYAKTKIIYLSPSDDLLGGLNGFNKLLMQKIGKNIFCSLEKIIDSGREVLIIVEGFDGYNGSDEKAIWDILDKIARHTGGRRIHILVNNNSIPPVNKLTQNIVNCPLPCNKFIEDKICEYQKKFGIEKISQRDVVKYCGPFLGLIKQYIRYFDANPKEKVLDKARTLWPLIKAGKFKTDAQVFKELIDMDDPEKKLSALCTPAEHALYLFLKTARGRLISREELISAVFDPSKEISDWAVDKLVSRFRKKLNMAGFEGKLETWKRRGFRWIG